MVDLDEGLRLIVGSEPVSRDALMRAVPISSDPEKQVTSRSATAGCRAVLAAKGGRIGLDVETLGRIALNATVDDSWLAVEERVAVAGSAEPVLELACRWVLKEAYGKALGVGLALPLDRIAFGARADEVVLERTAAPSSAGGWTFRLFRQGDTLFGVARQPAVQATPLAPAGMNPPKPLPDR